MHNLFSLSLSLSNAEGMQAGAMYSMYAGDAYMLLRFATAVQKCTGKLVLCIQTQRVLLTCAVAVYVKVHVV